MLDLTTLIRRNAESPDEAERRLAELAERNRAAVERDRAKIARCRSCTANGEIADGRQLAADDKALSTRPATTFDEGGQRDSSEPQNGQVAAGELVRLIAAWCQLEPDVRNVVSGLVVTLGQTSNAREGARV